MYGVLALLLAFVAGTQAYSCVICDPMVTDKTYCCVTTAGDHYCCSFEDYFFKGGFLDQTTLTILIGVGVGVLVLILVCICCCCCSCCPCYKRRRQGAVYNSVVPPGPPADPPAYHPGTATYQTHAQYPQQPPSNPYLVPNANAPAYYPPSHH